MMRYSNEVVEPNVLTQLVSYRVRQLQILAYKSFERVEAGFGTAPRYYGMLKIVQANPGISQTQLATAIHLDRSTLVPIMTTLTDEHWIERRPAKEDKRLRRVFLSADGEKWLADLDARAAAHEARITQGLSATERATLLALLSRVGKNLNADLAALD